VEAEAARAARRRILKATTALALALASAALVACDSGGASDPELAAANAALEAAVLTLDDFPEGWTADPADPDDGGSNLDLSEDCQILNRDSLPNEIATRDSDDFTGPESQGVTSGVTVFPTAGDAAAALSAVTDAYATCEDELLPEFEEQFRSGFDEGAGDSGAELADITVDLQEVPFTTDADATAAFRISYGGTAAGTPFEGAVDFVILQEERLVGGLVFFASAGDPDAAEEQQVAAVQLAKLREGNVGLAK
jgi:hypothetical protein